LLQKLELPLQAEFRDACATARKREPIDFTRLRFAWRPAIVILARAPRPPNSRYSPRATSRAHRK
jgi:hypothetical protein